MIHLNSDEKVILNVRKHWFVYLAEGIVVFFLMILPLVALKFIEVLSFLQISGSSFLLFVFLSSLWTLFCWNIFFILWTNNFLDMLIVTDKRVIDIEQISLFHRDASSFYLDRIEDITVERRGLLSNVFNYGHIHIQTAGEDRELMIHHVGEPERVRKIISETQHELEKIMS